MKKSEKTQIKQNFNLLLSAKEQEEFLGGGSKMATRGRKQTV
jgi:hypothetical protein